MSDLIRDIQEDANPDNQRRVSVPRLDPATNALSQSQLAAPGGVAGQLPTSPPVSRQTMQPILDEEAIPPAIEATGEAEAAAMMAEATPPEAVATGRPPLPLPQGENTGRPLDLVPPTLTDDTTYQDVATPQSLETLEAQLSERIQQTMVMEQQRFDTTVDPNLYRVDVSGHIPQPFGMQTTRPDIADGQQWLRNPLDDVLNPFDRINPLENVMDAQGMNRNGGRTGGGGNAIVGGLELMGKGLLGNIARMFYQIPGAPQYGGFESREEAFASIDQTYQVDMENPNIEAAIHASQQDTFGEYGGGVLGGFGYYADNLSGGNLIRPLLADISNVAFGTGTDRESRVDSLLAIVQTPFRLPAQLTGLTAMNDRVGAAFDVGFQGRAARGEEYSFMSPEDESGLAHTFVSTEGTGINLPNWITNRLPEADNILYSSEGEGGRLFPRVFGSGTFTGFIADAVTELPTDMVFDAALGGARRLIQQSASARQIAQATPPNLSRAVTSGLDIGEVGEAAPVARFSEVPDPWETPTSRMPDDVTTLEGSVLRSDDVTPFDNTVIELDPRAPDAIEVPGVTMLNDYNQLPEAWTNPRTATPPPAEPSSIGFNAPEIPDPWTTPALGYDAVQRGIVLAPPRPIVVQPPARLPVDTFNIDDLNAVVPAAQRTTGRLGRESLAEQVQEVFDRMTNSQQRRLLDGQLVRLQELRQVDADFLRENWRLAAPPANVITSPDGLTTAQRVLEAGDGFPARQVEVVDSTPFDAPDPGSEMVVAGSQRFQPLDFDVTDPENIRQLLEESQRRADRVRESFDRFSQTTDEITGKMTETQGRISEVQEAISSTIREMENQIGLNNERIAEIQQEATARITDEVAPTQGRLGQILEERDTLADEWQEHVRAVEETNQRYLAGEPVVLRDDGIPWDDANESIFDLYLEEWGHDPSVIEYNNNLFNENYELVHGEAPTIPDVDRAIIHEYHTGVGYRMVNDYLRGQPLRTRGMEKMVEDGVVLSLVGDRAGAFAQRVIEAYEKIPPMPRGSAETPPVALRVVSAPDVAQFEPGQVVNFDAISSWSFAADDPGRFVSTQAGEVVTFVGREPGGALRISPNASENELIQLPNDGSAIRVERQATLTELGVNLEEIRNNNFRSMPSEYQPYYVDGALADLLRTLPEDIDPAKVRVVFAEFIPVGEADRAVTSSFGDAQLPAPPQFTDEIVPTQGRIRRRATDEVVPTGGRLARDPDEPTSMLRDAAVAQGYAEQVVNVLTDEEITQLAPVLARNLQETPPSAQVDDLVGAVAREDYDEVWALAQEAAERNADDVTEDYIRQAAEAYRRGERTNVGDMPLTAEMPTVREMADYDIPTILAKLDEYGVDPGVAAGMSDRELATAWLSLTSAADRATNVPKLNAGDFRFVESMDELVSVEPDIALMERVLGEQAAAPMYLGTKVAEPGDFPREFQSLTAPSGNGWVLSETPEQAAEFAKAGLPSDTLINRELTAQGSVYEVEFTAKNPIRVTESPSDEVFDDVMQYIDQNFSEEAVDVFLDAEPESLANIFETFDRMMGDMGEDVGTEGQLFRQAVDDSLRSYGYDAKVTEYGTIPLNSVEPRNGVPVGDGSRLEQAVSRSNMGHIVGSPAARIDGAKARLELADELSDEIMARQMELDQNIQASFERTMTEREKLEAANDAARQQAQADLAREFGEESEFDMMDFDDLDEDWNCF